MGLIYKITNKQNNKIYIGKTIRSIHVRWLEHVNDALKGDKTPLHAAIKKYGVDQFKVEVIKDNIYDIEELNKLEKYYIALYHSGSHDNGYNIAEGGDGGRISSKLTQKEVDLIIALLQDSECLLSYKKIGQQFNISGSVIREINLGNTWYDPNLNYPIRKYDVTGLTITRLQYAKIVNDILTETDKTLAEICKQYELSEGQITAINQGTYCYNNNNLYYKGIYCGEYPIRKTNQKIFNEEKLKKAIYDIVFTNESITKIGNKYGIKGNTLTYISYGKRHKELTKNLLTPLRKYQKENQEILQKKEKE